MPARVFLINRTRNHLTTAYLMATFATMAYLDSTTRTMLEARLTRYETMLEAAYDAMDAAAAGAHIEHYLFDSGEGKQEVWAADPKSLERRIMWLEQMIRHVHQKLNGIGVVNLTMKRKY